MVDLVTGSQKFIKPAGIGGHGQQLSYRVSSHSRMAGSVPVWANSADTVSATDISLNNNLSAAKDAKTTVTPPSLSFGEILDIINPLHHLPIVGGIYRQMTGDTISPVARIAGGALFGGPIGAVAALANAAIQEHSGQDFTGNVMTAFNGSSAPRHHEKIKSWEDDRMAGNNKQNESKDHHITKDDTDRHETKLAASKNADGQVWKFNT